MSKATGPKPAHLRTGQAGEDAAAKWLKAKGWKILDRNWRSGPLELDLVCRQGKEIVFVEVKTRAAMGLGRPDQALTPQKKARLGRAALLWLSAHQAWDKPCRFDLVCALTQGQEITLELYSNVIQLEPGGATSDCGHSAWQPW